MILKLQFKIKIFKKVFKIEFNTSFLIFGQKGKTRFLRLGFQFQLASTLHLGQTVSVLFFFFPCVSASCNGPSWLPRPIAHRQPRPVPLAQFHWLPRPTISTYLFELEICTSKYFHLILHEICLDSSFIWIGDWKF